MRTVFIGAGNLATNLAKEMRKVEHEIIQVYSRTIESATTLAEAVDAEPTDDINAITTDADLYIISVKDSVLGDVVDRLCSRELRGTIVHTSGSISIDVFKGKTENYGVFYPMQSFSKQREVDFSIIPFFLEASDEEVMQRLDLAARSLTGNVYHITSEARKHLHLSAVFACNFVNHCYELSAELLQKYGIPFDVMLPLIDETARKVHTVAPRDAQTGPAIRYDENVMGMQTGLLADNQRLLDIYTLLSKSIHEVATGER